MQKNFLDHPGPIALAHRGGNEKFPENTLAAFQFAYDIGYRYFETDVHYTAGGELVAFHDDHLARITGYKGRIADMTAAERQALRIDGKYEIPLLKELLEAFPDVYFNIDAKNKAAVQPLVETVKACGAPGRVCLASFSAGSVAIMRRQLPDACTVATRYEAGRLRLGMPYLGKLMKRQLIDCLQVPAAKTVAGKKVFVVNQRFIKRIHGHGLKVFVWTVNEPADMKKLLDLGVDGIFTDKVSLLKKVMEDRGLWRV